MFCKNCGMELNEGANFCAFCGIEISNSSKNRNIESFNNNEYNSNENQAVIAPVYNEDYSSI